MNNKELVNELSSRLGYTNKDAATLVSSIVSIMGEGFSNGKKASLDGFGQFEVKKKMERITVNPLTQQRLLVPPKLVLTYKPSPILKDKFKNTSADE